VQPSEDTLQRVLPLVVRLLEPGEVLQCFQASKAWRRELEARGFCHKTLLLYSSLAQGRTLAHLGQIALERLCASTGQAERGLWSDAYAFLQRSGEWIGTLHQWLQAASQEPDASFLSRGAASTAQILGLPLVRWDGKPEGRYPGFCTLAGNSGGVNAVAFSEDGTRVASGSDDMLVKIWDIATGAEVSSEVVGMFTRRFSQGLIQFVVSAEGAETIVMSQ
jgi:WD40 repeat protein